MWIGYSMPMLCGSCNIYLFYFYSYIYDGIFYTVVIVGYAINLASLPQYTDKFTYLFYLLIYLLISSAKMN